MFYHKNSFIDYSIKSCFVYKEACGHVVNMFTSEDIHHIDTLCYNAYLVHVDSTNNFFLVFSVTQLIRGTAYRTNQEIIICQHILLDINVCPPQITIKVT